MSDIVREALENITTILEERGIEYAITGSFAAAAYGAIRATADVDVKIAADHLDERLPELERAARARGFTIRDELLYSYLDRFDVDLYPARDSLDKESLTRRKFIQLLPASEKKFPIVTVEDLLLIKIREHAKYPDAKHVEDARVLITLNREGLDVEYLETRLERYGLMRAWGSYVEPGDG